MVARNSGKYLPDIFTDIAAQDFPKSDVEFLLVDGMSADNTKQLVREFSAANTDVQFRFLENPGKILSSGWNAALKEAKGDIIMRIDAHSRIPVNFISKNVEAIKSGHAIVGGPRITRLPENGVPRFLALAEVSRFGAGCASYRHVGKAGYTDTLAHAAYRRDVFGKVGGYNEELVRNQDNEIHRRMKNAGYRFWFTPEIWSEHFARTDLSTLLKQKFGNGYWIAIVSGFCPKCFGLRHFVPFMFLMALFITIIAAIFVTPEPLYLLLSVYCGSAAFFTAEAVKSESIEIKLLSLCMPILFLFMHFSYGLGTLCGFLILPFKWKRLRSYKPPFPITESGCLDAVSLRSGPAKSFEELGEGKAIG